MGEAHHSKMHKYEQGKISNFFPWDTQMLIEHSVKKSYLGVIFKAHQINEYFGDQCGASCTNTVLVATFKRTPVYDFFLQIAQLQVKIFKKYKSSDPQSPALYWF